MTNISLVSYSNTLPFKYALANSDYISGNAVLNERNPADCAADLISGEADIALLPVGALSLLTNYRIISDFCLSAYKKVESVLLLSERPKEEITEIILDYQSRTSVKLIKVLAENYWKEKFLYSDAKPGFENHISGTKAAVVIGDRALNIRNSYRYVYDLAEEWYNFTGMPAVFAVWVTRKDISPDFLYNFNNVLRSGVENRLEIAKKMSANYPGFDLENYLGTCIDYRFDEKKKESMNMFFDMERRL